MSEESPGKPRPKYRPDIDGLRAVAVLAVLAYHAGIAVVISSGGYVGVDVFFVISGYLISSIVFSEIASSRFSIMGFYQRRIRRIFPALFCMLIVYSVIATIDFLPADLVGFAKSLLAATTSTSNFYFWLHSSYFDSPLSNPLVHTWSLAVEEQFYIFFPLFLAVVRKCFPERLRTAVVVLFFASLIASAIMVPLSRNTAFYMPYTRAWELLLGTMLSLGMFPRLKSGWKRNLTTLSGASMIGGSIVFYTVNTPFPGLAALPPCIGSALIIGAGESGSSLVSSVLSWRPVVFVGLISYSLYLWHWPVILLQQMGVLLSMNTTLPARYAALIAPRHYSRGVDVLLSFVVAVISWRFVERPFRAGSLRLSGRPLFALAGAVMMICTVFSCWTIYASGFAGRFSYRAEAVASYLDPTVGREDRRRGVCFIADEKSLKEFNFNLCLHYSDGEKNYLLLGDSHAASLWKGVATDLPNDNVMQANASDCRPFVHPVGTPACKEMMNYIFQTYLPSHPVQGLLLEARWAPGDAGKISETVDWAREHGVPVSLIGPVQEYDTPLPRLLAYSIYWNQPDFPTQHRTSLSKDLDSQFATLAANTWKVPYLSLYKATCNTGVCIEYADADNKVPLMYDGDHLSPLGSVLLVSRLVDQGELR